MTNTKKETENLQFAAKTSAFTLNKCLYPGLSCKRKAIKAHSVQNAQTLELVAHKGHVVGIQGAFRGLDPPSIKLRYIGRNKATTFTGLCAQHDSELFEPIDRQLIDPENEEQLFLLAYRSIIRELHSCMTTAIKIQSSYERRIRRGLDSPDAPSKAGLIATERFMVAYEVHEYRVEFDKALLSHDYSSIQHKLLIFEDQEPAVAASTFFSLDDHASNGETPRLVLNILPVTGYTTAVIFSYKKSEVEPVNEFLGKVLSASGNAQKYELSRLLLNHCENFVLAPKIYERWSTEKRSTIEYFMVKTLLHNDYEFQSEHLLLFQ